MTAKRFTIENDIEMKDNWNINKRCYHFGNGFDAKDCCNMLNELQNENKELKKENEQLKTDNGAFIRRYGIRSHRNWNLREKYHFKFKRFWWEYKWRIKE